MHYFNDFIDMIEELHVLHNPGNPLCGSNGGLLPVGVKQLFWSPFLMEDKNFVFCVYIRIIISTYSSFPLFGIYFRKQGIKYIFFECCVYTLES